jgi:hypothetical protein
MDNDIIFNDDLFVFEPNLFSTSPYVFNEIEAIIESEYENNNEFSEQWRLVMRDVVIHSLRKRIKTLENDVKKTKFGNDVYLSIVSSTPAFIK